MEPWRFGSDGIGKALLFSDEMDLPVDAFARSGYALMEWETKPYYSFEGSGLVSDHSVAAESVEFMDLGFTDITRKHFPYNLALGEYGGEVGSDSSKASPTCMLTPNSSFGEVESGLKLSTPIMECNSHDDCSLVDLKLGRLADCDGANSKSTKGVSVATKARTTSSYSQTPICQVQGCKVDLISSKEYYKRHKVCDAHSKSARVIVNGIEQRFCQQCSRFHLLIEFDEGKCSCRKRLAYHNERRRKHQVDSFFGKPHKLLQSTRGTRFGAASSSKRSPFVLYPDKYGEANRISHIELEKESIFSPQLAEPMMNRQLHAKSYPHLCGIGQQHCSGVSLDTASTVQELSGTSNSSCALSLLSNQSKDLSSYSAGTYMGGTLFYPGEHADDQISEGIASVKGKYAANEFHSSMRNAFDADQMGSIMLRDGIVRGSGFSGSQHWFSPEHGTTVDLLQLSSHLQRVEQQRNSMPVKEENEDFSCFLATQWA